MAVVKKTKQTKKQKNPVHASGCLSLSRGSCEAATAAATPSAPVAATPTGASGGPGPSSRAPHLAAPCCASRQPGLGPRCRLHSDHMSPSTAADPGASFARCHVALGSPRPTTRRRPPFSLFTSRQRKRRKPNQNGGSALRSAAPPPAPRRPGAALRVMAAPNGR